MRSVRSLVTARVTAFRLDPRDIKILIDEVLVERSQAKLTVSLKRTGSRGQRDHSPFICEVSDHAHFFASSGLDPSSHVELGSYGTVMGNSDRAGGWTLT